MWSHIEHDRQSVYLLRKMISRENNHQVKEKTQEKQGKIIIDGLRAHSVF